MGGYTLSKCEFQQMYLYKHTKTPVVLTFKAKINLRPQIWVKIVINVSLLRNLCQIMHSHLIPFSYTVPTIWCILAVQKFYS